MDKIRWGFMLGLSPTINKYRRLPRGKPIGSNEDSLLEYSWIGEYAAVKRLQHMLKYYHPQIVFFMETKLKANRMEKVRRRCGFFNGNDVAAEGSRGDLSLGWNGGQLVNLNSFSKNHIDVEIKEEEEKPRWRFTGFYGDPMVRNKAETWDLLRRLGGVTCYLGWSELTWERGRTLERNIRERIDRGVVTDSWIQIFPNYSLRHLPHSFFDHCPFLIETEVLEETCEEEI
ncbi:reverse transcriptase [Gossypium australe]|uniref:Reverse transcriptase n=1 Tax=Gossypium australe TaxID=47621 RepID=A0A5B6VDU8_9ROSI|nr:reverse transcriptase [Gossypium australe]